MERMLEPMTDKQYEGMLKDNIACLDRIAKCAANDKDVLRQIFYERKLPISFVTMKLGSL